jgi:hypothetical protein
VKVSRAVESESSGERACEGSKNGGLWASTIADKDDGVHVGSG